MATRMLQRRGTAAEWAAENPILADGEMGFETDTKIIKMGDGVTTWANLGLPYLTTGGGTMTGALNLIAPTSAAHAARKADVDALGDALSTDIDAVDTKADSALAVSWKHIQEWVASNRGTGVSEGSYIAHGGEVTITNPGVPVYVQALQEGYISKGPAVGGGIEIGFTVQISFNNGDTYITQGPVITLIANNDRNSGGGYAVFGHRQGTPSGNIKIRLSSKRSDTNTGVVNANATGGYVRVEAV